MDFQVTDEQKMIADTARKVGERFGLDYWRDHDKRKAFPHEFWKLKARYQLPPLKR
jgi:acyl-CoA dehydrogenase